jgi:lipopolysaccharide/colanic/teichoic acid biosynthesis glycosyltransferase
LIQINAHRNLSREERERYNLFYLNNYSLLLDLEILLKLLTYTTYSEIT